MGSPGALGKGIINWSRLWHLALLALFAGAVIYPVFLSAKRDLDPDEIEHIRASWLVSRGQLPYRDFFFNHNPLLWYLLRWPVDALGPQDSTVAHLRTVMLLVPLSIALLTYKLARLLLGESSRAPPLACLSLFYLPLFLDKVVEIRPDGPMVVFWLTSLTLWISALKRDQGGGRLALLSGLAMGVSFAFKQTALLALVPLGATALYFLLRREIEPRLLLWFAAGLALVGGVFALMIQLSVGLDLYLESCLTYNFHLPSFLPFRIFLRSIAGDPFFFVAGASGALGALLTLRSAPRDKVQLTFLVSAAFLLASFFVVRAPWSQYLLPVLPLLAIYAGSILEKSIVRLRERDTVSRDLATAFLFLFIIGGVAMPIWSVVHPEAGFSPFYQGFSSRRSMQLETMRFILDNTAPDEAIFDGFAIYIFRPAACRCWSLGFVTGDPVVDEGLGCLPQQIIKCMEGVRIMVEDKRVLKMEAESEEFRQYVDSHFDPPDANGVRFRTR